jgi:hypothetical protein
MLTTNPSKVALFITVFFHLHAFAIDPPDSIEKAFKEKFPRVANSKWTVNKQQSNAYTAEFTFEKERIKAHFDMNGNYLESEKKFSIKYLPETIPQVLETQFERYSIQKCIEVTKPNGEKKYKIAIKSQGNKTYLVMSKEGNWIPIEKF